MANGSRGSHQRAQTTPWFESLSLSGRRWHATLGGLGGDRRQSDQYRSVPGCNEHGIGMGRLAVITRKREREKTQKNVAPEGIHGLGSGNRFSRSSFLRRKVASRFLPLARATLRYPIRIPAVLRFEATGNNLLNEAAYWGGFRPRLQLGGLASPRIFPYPITGWSLIRH